MTKNSSGAPARAGRTADWLFALHEVLAWYSGIVFTGLSIKKRDDDWLLVLRGTKGKKPVVLFVSGDDFEDCVLTVAKLVSRGQDSWLPDRFA